jgi:hypothetical protein
MNAAQQSVEATIEACVADAYKLTPSIKTDAFIEALEAVDFPSEETRARDACTSLRLMFEVIRRDKCYNYSFLYGAHVVNVQKEWFEIVNKYEIMLRTGASVILRNLDSGKRSNSIAEEVSKYLDALVVSNVLVSTVKARLHRVLIQAPDGVSKIGTEEAMRVFRWVMYMWVHIPRYEVEYHNMFQDVYKAYEGLVRANANAKADVNEEVDE